MAASVVGIGVSVVGFTMINKKLNGMNEKLHALSEKLIGIETAIGQLRDHQRLQKFARLTSLLSLGEEAWNKHDKLAIWGRISDQLLEEDHYYRHLLSGTKATSSIFLDEAYPLEFCVFILENLAMVNASRFQSLLLCNELETAKQYSLELSAWYHTVFDPLSPIDIALSKASYVAKQSTRRFDDVKGELLQTTKPLMHSLREVQTNMASRPQLIQTLIDQNVDSYKYVRRLRQEDQQPVLILPDNTALE